MTRKITVIIGWLLAVSLGAATLQAQPLTAPEGTGGVPPGPACDDGAVKDDGTAESGKGWVPSVLEGQYVQEYSSADFPTFRLESLCLCWLRTNPDASIDYEVVFYEAVPAPDDETPETFDLVPAEQPYAVVPATATGVPNGVPGAFYEVDLGSIPIPLGTFYAGVRWDASASQFFFLCTDTTPTTPATNAYFRDEQAEGWFSVLKTIDPIFADHRAFLIRPQASRETVVEVPALGWWGLVGLAVGLGWVGWRRLGGG